VKFRTPARKTFLRFSTTVFGAGFVGSCRGHFLFAGRVFRLLSARFSLIGRVYESRYEYDVGSLADAWTCERRRKCLIAARI
jgi:hypothetical protein